MATSSPQPDPGANWALSCLPRGEHELLFPSLELVPLDHLQILHETGQRIPFVYFPCSGVVSLLCKIEENKFGEVAVVGKEGIVGLPVLFGNDLAPNRAQVQSPGQAWRIRSDLFRAKVRLDSSLAVLLLRYADALCVQITQSALCNCLHPLVKRCCRWLLMAHDRVESEHLPFPQKFLALMLAVRLASVSGAARTLQKAGLISYNRGRIRIHDRKGLEAACCGCYRIIQDRFDALYNGWPGNVSSVRPGGAH